MFGSSLVDLRFEPFSFMICGYDLLVWKKLATLSLLEAPKPLYVLDVDFIVDWFHAWSFDSISYLFDLVL